MAAQRVKISIEFNADETNRHLISIPLSKVRTIEFRSLNFVSTQLRMRWSDIWEFFFYENY